VWNQHQDPHRHRCRRRLPLGGRADFVGFK
jgi:hypothetical protein